DALLHLARHALAGAFGGHAVVAGRLADAFLHGALGVLGGALDLILVHGSTPLAVTGALGRRCAHYAAAPSWVPVARARARRYLLRLNPSHSSRAVRTPHGAAIYFPDAGPDQGVPGGPEEDLREHLAVLLSGRQDRRRRCQRLGQVHPAQDHGRARQG